MQVAMSGMLVLLFSITAVGCNSPILSRRTNWDYHHEHPECVFVTHHDGFSNKLIYGGEVHYEGSAEGWNEYDCPDGSYVNVDDSDAKGRP